MEALPPRMEALLLKMEACIPLPLAQRLQNPRLQCMVLVAQYTNLVSDMP